MRGETRAERSSTSQSRPDAAQDFTCRDRDARIVSHLGESSLSDSRHDGLVNFGVYVVIDAHAIPQRGEKPELLFATQRIEPWRDLQRQLSFFTDHSSIVDLTRRRVHPQRRTHRATAPNGYQA